MESKKYYSAKIIKIALSILILHRRSILFRFRCQVVVVSLFHEKNGSGSTRPGTNSAPESTRPRVNSARSTRPVYFPYGESGYHICT